MDKACSSIIIIASASDTYNSFQGHVPDNGLIGGRVAETASSVLLLNNWTRFGRGKRAPYKSQILSSEHIVRLGNNKLYSTLY